MAIANHRKGKVLRGKTLPYGTLTMSEEDSVIRQAYYYYGYRKDEDLPPLPCIELDEQVADPEEELARKEEQAYIKDLLDGLTLREAKVLRMRYGIDLNRDMSLDEVGQVLDVSRERIRQIEAKALRKLKHPDRKLWAILNPEDVAEGYKHDQKRLRQRMYEIEMIHQGWMWMTRQLNKGVVPVKRETATFWIDHIKETDSKLYWHFDEQVTKRLDDILTYRLCAPYDHGRTQTQGRP